MIRSRNFWIGIVSLAIIPLLLIYIGEHRIDWEKEVWNETIYLVQSVYPCDKQQKAIILDTLKDKYEGRDDIHYLYIARGFGYLWKKQIQKYDVQGHHIFLSDEQYDNLCRKCKQDTAALVFMSTYMIADKKGKIVVSDARWPDRGDLLYMQLNKYLAQNP